MHGSLTDDRKVSHNRCLWNITGPIPLGRQCVNSNARTLNMLNCTTRA